MSKRGRKPIRRIQESTSTSSVSTMSGNERARNFFITVNKDIEQFIESIEKETKKKNCTIKYVGIGNTEEAPSTGHEHVHSVIYYQNQRTLNSLKRKYKKYGEVEIIRNEDKALRYIKKKNELQFEWGEKPHQGSRNDLRAAFDECKTLEEFDELHPDLYAKYRIGIESHYTRLKANERWDSIINSCRDGSIHKKRIKVYYIIGAPGTGKSTNGIKFATKELGYKTREIGRIKFSPHGFCLGHRVGEKCLIWNEFSDEEVPFKHFLEICDKLGYDLNIKHSNEFIVPETIIINTTIKLENIYKDEKEEDRVQVYRRIYCYYKTHIQIIRNNKGLLEEEHTFIPIDISPLKGTLSLLEQFRNGDFDNYTDDQLKEINDKLDKDLNNYCLFIFFIIINSII